MFYLRDVCDEEQDEEAKKARSMVVSLYEGKAKYLALSFFFSRILSYILRLQEKPLVLFAQEPVEVWEIVDGVEVSTTEKYYRAFANDLESIGINHVKWGEAEKIKDLAPTHLIVVDLASDDECRDEIFQKVFEFYPSSKPVMAYFSLVKQCNDDDTKVFRERERQIKEAEERERQRKEAEEQERRRKKAEERERQRKEAEDWIRRRREIIERWDRDRIKYIERQKQQQEAQKKAKKLEAAQRRLEAAQRKPCLINLVETLNRIRISGRKADSKKILQILEEQGIKYLYHFTDASNIESIKAQGGLYSREYCEEHNIVIPKPGGDDLSVSLDARHNLEDYVRLSFNKTHPMSFKLQISGKYNLVWLKIKLDVALARETLFSDMNATKTGHHHGGTFEDFQMIDFEAVNGPCPTNDSPLYSKHQAEVLVKTFIPIEYIVNIDNPEPYTL